MVLIHSTACLVSSIAQLGCSAAGDDDVGPIVANFSACMLSAMTIITDSLAACLLLYRFMKDVPRQETNHPGDNLQVVCMQMFAAESSLHVLYYLLASDRTRVSSQTARLTTSLATSGQADQPFC